MELVNNSDFEFLSAYYTKQIHVQIVHRLIHLQLVVRLPKFLTNQMDKLFQMSLFDLVEYWRDIHHDSHHNLQ